MLRAKEVRRCNLIGAREVMHCKLIKPSKFGTSSGSGPHGVMHNRYIRAKGIWYSGTAR